MPNTTPDGQPSNEPSQQGFGDQPSQPQPQLAQHQGQPQSEYPQAGLQQPGPNAPLNTLSIVGFILAFIVAPVGAILGHVSLSQIKKRFERGRGLALAAVIIGWIATGIWFITVIGMIAFAFIFTSQVNEVFDEFESSQSAPESPWPDSSEPGAPGEPGEGNGQVDADTPGPDFCAVVNSLDTIDPADQEAITEKYRELAATRGDHPNADAYQSYYESVRDGDEEKAASLQEEVRQLMGEDVQACNKAGY